MLDLGTQTIEEQEEEAIQDEDKESGSRSLLSEATVDVQNF